MLKVHFSTNSDVGRLFDLSCKMIWCWWSCFRCRPVNSVLTKRPFRLLLHLLFTVRCSTFGSFFFNVGVTLSELFLFFSGGNCMSSIFGKKTLHTKEWSFWQQHINSTLNSCAVLLHFKNVSISYIFKIINFAHSDRKFGSHLFYRMCQIWKLVERIVTKNDS